MNSTNDENEMFVSLIIKEIKEKLKITEIKNESNVRKKIKEILCSKELLYQDEGDNLLDVSLKSKIEVNVVDSKNEGHTVDINLIVGKLIREEFHKLLIQYNMILKNCGLRFRKRLLYFGHIDHELRIPDSLIPDFIMPDHLFGLPTNYASRVTGSSTSRYRSNVIADFTYPGINEKIRSIFKRVPIKEMKFSFKYSDLEKVSVILRNEGAKGEMFHEKILKLFDETDTVGDFCFCLPLLRDMLLCDIDEELKDSKLMISDEELAIIINYLVLIASNCTDDNYKAKIEDELNNINFELLVKARDKVYLDDNFLRNMWSLIVFLKQSKQDEQWFDNINMAFFIGDDESFKKIICSFYKKYSYCFLVERYDSDDIENIAEQIYLILDDPTIKDEDTTNFFVKKTFGQSLPLSKELYSDDLVNRCFDYLSGYTKAVLYSDYQIYDLLYRLPHNYIRYCGSNQNIHVFDLLLSNDLLTIYEDPNSKEEPNFIKIRYKLEIIKEILNVIKDNYLRMSFMDFRYEINPIDVVFVKHMGSSDYYDVQLGDKKVVIMVKVDEKNGKLTWDVVSIKEQNMRKNSAKKAVIMGGRY